MKISRVDENQAVAETLGKETYESFRNSLHTSAERKEVSKFQYDAQSGSKGLYPGERSGFGLSEKTRRKSRKGGTFVGDFATGRNKSILL